MTSKEALEKWYETISVNDKIRWGDNYLSIKKDLEVLEILKKHIKLTPYKTVSGFKDEGMSDDEFNKVKEWVENEKM